MKDGKVVYCTADDTVNPVGSDSKAGKMSPRNLWVTTIGDELRLATNNRSKVIGVALKDRASILPAGHHANGAFWFDSNLVLHQNKATAEHSPKQEMQSLPLP